MTERTALYRLYDGADQLLYIGVATSPPLRWQQHSRSSAWWPDVAKLTLQWFATRQHALRAEKAAIKQEHPRHNEVHNRPDVQLRRNVDPALAKRMLKARVARYPHLKHDLEAAG